MIKKIAVFTGSRAEYGLLFFLLRDIENDPDLQLQLIVSGAHLSHEFGNTYTQIEQDGFTINEKIEILLSSDTSIGVAKSIGLGILGFSDALNRLEPNILVVLGDRYEAFAAAQTAMILRIPVLHIHGGEITEGAYDDAIRHAITKLSYIHCTSTEEYRNRVIQLGEMPERVKNVGAIGLDYLKRGSFLSLHELSTSLGFSISKPYFLVTYHPVTLAKENAEESFRSILDSLDAFPDYQVIITYPNADDRGRGLISMIETYAQKQPSRVFAFSSLGQQRYLSAVKNSTVVIGNSSSGIIEVPAFKVPTVNIGLRQKGRLAGNSVIHCEAVKSSIIKAISSAIDGSYKEKHIEIINPYGEGNASQQIVNIMKTMDINLVKNFYDLKVK